MTSCFHSGPCCRSTEVHDTKARVVSPRGTLAALSLAALSLGLCVSVSSGAQAQEGGAYTVPEVEVIGVAPLHGTGVEKGKVPANVKLIGGRTILETGTPDLGTALYREIPSVTLNDAQNNPFQRDINVRGYVASPLLGNAQGLAVYMNGSRINEGFGEEVQWDLMPDFAIDQVQLIPGANAVYGLNALGGALSLRMKNGFDNPGMQVTFSGGSFGRFQETLEYGTNVGDYAAYIGISRIDEDGWRDYSQSELTRIFGDVRYRGNRLLASVSMNLASTDLNGNGLAPIGLLRQNREAVFTYPDNTRNRLAHVVANVAYDVNDSTSIEGMAYYRLLERKTLNGDEFEGEECVELGDEDEEGEEEEEAEGVGTLIGDDDDDIFPDDDDLTALLASPGSPFGTDADDLEELICGEVDFGEFAEEFEEEFEEASAAQQPAIRTKYQKQVAKAIIDSVLVKRDGELLEEDDLNGEEEVNGAFNRSTTVTNSVGGSLQASFEGNVSGFDNLLIAGIGVDRSSTKYHNSAQIGFLTDSRTVDALDVFLSTRYGLRKSDAVAGVGRAARDKTLYSYRSVIRGDTTAVGIYFTDTLDITDSLAATVAGRFNWTEVGLQDVLAATKENHTYSRFNPSVGLTYQVNNRLGLFANYSEANRAPSPVELSCADEQNPCRVPNAFVADPPLEQVVNRSVEIGARGTGLQSGLSYAWSVAGFAGRNYDDILFVRSSDSGNPVGVGFFKNAGQTQRVGAEAEFNARWQGFAFGASYAYIDATFRSSVDFPEHELTVPPKDEVELENKTKSGDRIPGIPRHNLRLNLDYNITDSWVIGLEGLYSSNQVMRGDEGNKAPKVSGYGLMNAHMSYSLSDRIEAFVHVDNLLDTKYETYGLVGEEPGEVIDGLKDNRFFGPGAPRGIWGGFRIGF